MAERPPPKNPHGLQPMTEELLRRLLVEMNVEEPEHAKILEALMRRMRAEGITPIGMLLVPDTFDGLVAVAQTMLERHYPRDHVLGDAFLSYLRAALDCLGDPHRTEHERYTVGKRRRVALAESIKSAMGRAGEDPK